MQTVTTSNNGEAASKPKRALRISSVLDKVGISRTQLYRLIERGQFPQQFHLSERTAVWDEAEVDAWLSAKHEGHTNGK
jgi:prophage regulatory protein